MPRQTITRRDLLKKSFLMMAGAQAIPGLLAGSAQANSGDAAQSIPLREPAISTVHPEADIAAQKAFANGGNAVDAAIAAMMALCVVIPVSIGFGGYGGSMVLYQARRRRVTAVDFDSRAPLEFRPELVRQDEQMKHGYLAVGVPGVVAGFDFALRKFGRLKWRTVSEHAILLAEEGFEVPPGLSKALKGLVSQMDPGSLKAFFPTGRAPEPGERWKQKDLARMIRALGEQGPESFYRGDIGRQIVRQIRANGGVLSEKDLKSYKPEEVSPAQIDYRGNQIFTPPPPSGGLTSLSILKTLEQFDLASLEPWGADYFHRFAGAAKLCWAERFQEFGDPESVKFSMKELLSTQRAIARAEKIRRGKISSANAPGPGPGHTGNVVVIDTEGNCVSITATHGSGFGAHVAIEGLGLVLGQGMSRFTLDPKSPNAPQPHKRMQHNMSPMLILRDGRPAYVLGMPGGRMIVTVTAQMVVSVIDFKASAEAAVYAPRLHTEGEEPLTMSPKTPKRVVKALEALGHTVKLGGVANTANMAIIDRATGKVDYCSGRKLAA